MKNYLLFVICAILFLSGHDVSATHIVGGQLFITENSNAVYNKTIGLTMYFDALNGNPGAEDQEVMLYIFRKRDNASVAYVRTPKIERKSVTYANPACGISNLQTYMITYSINVRMDASVFNDDQGYYIVWDRCCRNGTITNIKNPGDAGSLFYLEFPPVSKGSREFHNSSPIFPAIVGDYACVNSPFFFDFGGTDADGDSLTYRLITPMQGFSDKNNPSVPGVGSSNYPRLTWQDGISVSNIIPGPKPLAVDSKTGRLSVTPGNTGLYVFAVQVDEFRNGVKIGTLTRDFQLKVVDCPKMEPPKVLFKPKGSTKFYTENEIITFKAGDPNCFEAMVTDPSVNQLVRVRGQLVNSQSQYFSLLPTQYVTQIKNDTLRFQVCLDDCFATYDNRPLRLQLIAEDESCPVPLIDTLTIYIRRPASNNTAPTVSTSLTSDYMHVTAGVPVKFTVYGKDSDNDSLSLSGAGAGFTMVSQSMTFPNVTGKSSVQSTFAWTPPCNARVGDTLTVNFTAKDLRCVDNALGVQKSIYFVVEKSPNTPPTVATSLATTSIRHEIAAGATIRFDVIATDPDTNQISLAAAGEGFDMIKMGMSFTAKNGLKELTSPYGWTPDCSLLEGASEKTFLINFVTADKTCMSASDTTTVEITVYNPEAAQMPEIPNVITPNRDGKNDCFVFDDFPEDNCTNQFIDVTVFNRWGKQVFFTASKSLNWCPTDVSAGYYLYVVRYTNQTYKGGLTVLK